MPVTMTETAAGEVKRILSEQSVPDGTVLRVAVKGRRAYAQLQLPASQPASQLSLMGLQNLSKPRSSCLSS